MSLFRTTRGGKQVEIALNGGAVMGTAPGCQIIVADPAAAAKQCKVVKSPKGYVLTDLTSVGTSVNGTKVREHVLRAGDVVQIGSEKFVFAEKAPSPQAPEPVAAGVKAASASAPAAASSAPSGGRRPLPSRAPAASGGPAKPNGARGTSPIKKLTAKPGSVSRVHKSHSVFTLPSTQKGRVIALSVAIGLVLLGGGLLMLSLNTVNSDQVKAQAKEHLERFNKIPETEIQKRLDMAEEILANENYVKMAKMEIAPLYKVRDGLKKVVELEKRADGVLIKFIDEYKGLKAGPPDQYNSQADRMWDNVGVHYENFQTTKYRAQLEEIRGELKEFLEKRGLQTWSTEIPTLTREVQKLITANNYSQALVDVDAFGKKYDEKAVPQLKSKLQEERDKIRDTSKSFVEKLKNEAAGMATKDEKKKKLEGGRPHVKGIADAERALEAAINAIR